MLTKTQKKKHATLVKAVAEAWTVACEISLFNMGCTADPVASMWKFAAWERWEHCFKLNCARSTGKSWLVHMPFQWKKLRRKNGSWNFRRSAICVPPALAVVWPLCFLWPLGCARCKLIVVVPWLIGRNVVNMWLRRPIGSYGAQRSEMSCVDI